MFTGCLKKEFCPVNYCGSGECACRDHSLGGLYCRCVPGRTGERCELDDITKVHCI